MTEAEWLAAYDPEVLLEYFRFRGRDREARLFACAVCRHMFQSITVNPWDTFAVEQAERYADGQIGYAELDEAWNSTTSDWTAAFACRDAASPEGGIEYAMYAADNVAYELAESGVDRIEVLAEQLALLRCIVGNPFRPVAFEPRWQSEHTVGIARKMYDDRDFAAMPILADALEEAGCDVEAVLTHCRQPGPHARGCWVVDGILGKW